MGFNSTEDMSDDSDRELRRLIKKLGISFKGLNTDALPIEHRETFKLIRSIRNKTLHDYRKDITFQSNEPWRKQTHDRVKWLACRATSLVNQQRNEAGWRFTLENDVFHRFRVEVAWLVLHILLNGAIDSQESIDGIKSFIKSRT
jgi:hypothetical protein